MGTSLDLTGKVAIVTGASRGIGEAIARALSQGGAKVVLAARKIESLQAVASSLGPGARAFAAHTGKESDCDALVGAAIETFGEVDILVNNAATNPYFGPLLDAPKEAWDKTFEVNVRGYFLMARAVAKHLQKRGGAGSIVQVASVAALEAAPMMGVYAMTKAAIVSMTKTMAYELAGSNIRINTIAPGFVDTKFASAIVQNESLMADVVKKTPLGRIAKPDEIAGAAVFLASDASSYMTGHTLVLDGGMTIC